MRFLDVQPTIQNQWRSVILFGRNVASYKFALAKSLLYLGSRPNELVRLEDLAIPYSRFLCEHLARSPKQATSASSTFLSACRQANAGEISNEELLAVTQRLGFNNVIDAFHRLGPGDISTRFFIDERRGSKGIRITEHLAGLAQGQAASDLGDEAEARWRLVETAWELGVAHPLIEHDTASGSLVVRKSDRRATVTSARAALNGYQKGRCFYCFDGISVTGESALADIDHFIPWSLRTHVKGNIDGVWNLVLSCRTCNRGPAGKFDSVPAVPLLERLHARNEFLILSHHPLRETLMTQTGLNGAARAEFLQSTWAEVALIRGAQWLPTEKAERAF